MQIGTDRLVQAQREEGPPSYDLICYQSCGCELLSVCEMKAAGHEKACAREHMCAAETAVLLANLLGASVSVKQYPCIARDPFSCTATDVADQPILMIQKYSYSECTT